MPEQRELHGDRWPFLQSLPFRVVAFLSLALLPIGLLAIWQTQNLDDTLRARTELSLVALTEIAVSGERQTLERAVGAARGQAVTYNLTADDPEECSMAFKAFRDADPTISFAGFLPPDGEIVCSSADGPITLPPSDRVNSITSATSISLMPRLGVNPGDEDIAVLTQPVTENGATIGQIVLTMPTASLSAVPDLDSTSPPLSLTIFNEVGDIIASEGEAPATDTIRLSEDRFQPSSGQPSIFLDRNANGDRRIFVVLTLVPDLAYAMTGWAPKEGFLASDAITLPSFFLPALMWVASLLVAYFAVHRLVVGPVQDLGGRMRRFASDRSLPQPKNTDTLPQELFNLEQTFVNMAYDLIDDEARMENSLREKNVLLKEVHHRVKNNLQMISSIMNMQIRAATSQESRHALRRLQDRVLGLATVHRILYQSTELARADARPLMEDICGAIFAQLAEVNSAATPRLIVDRITLIPDQAVPLALLVGEVGTNAIQHMPQSRSPAPILEISLQIVSPGRAQFRCRTTVAPETPLRDGAKGVGWQLIRAFAMQLGGAVEDQLQDGIQTISVEFPLTTNIPDAIDY